MIALSCTSVQPFLPAILHNIIKQKLTVQLQWAKIQLNYLCMYIDIIYTVMYMHKYIMHIWNDDQGTVVCNIYIYLVHKYILLPSEWADQSNPVLRIWHDASLP